MTLRINNNDSTSKTAIKGGIAGATVGAGIIAYKKIKPFAKDAFESSIKAQKDMLQHYKNINATAGTFAEEKEMINSVNSEFISSVAKSIKEPQQAEGFFKYVDKILQKGKDNALKSVHAKEEVFKNGRPSKYTAGKTATKAVFNKIGTKLEQMGDSTYNFIKSKEKINILKANKGKLSGGIKKYGLPILAAAAISSVSAVVTKKIMTNKEEE